MFIEEVESWMSLINPQNEEGEREGQRDRPKEGIELRIFCSCVSRRCWMKCSSSSLLSVSSSISRVYKFGKWYCSLLQCYFLILCTYISTLSERKIKLVKGMIDIVLLQSKVQIFTRGANIIIAKWLVRPSIGKTTLSNATLHYLQLAHFHLIPVIGKLHISHVAAW